MAEKKAAAEKVEKVSEETTPSMLKKKESKESRWTRELCMRFAKRFHTREEWQKGAPASFKAAVSRGWADECTAAMPKAVASIGSARKSGSGKKVAKVS